MAVPFELGSYGRLQIRHMLINLQAASCDAHGSMAPHAAEHWQSGH